MVNILCNQGCVVYSNNTQDVLFIQTTHRMCSLFKQHTGCVVYSNNTQDVLFIQNMQKVKPNDEPVYNHAPLKQHTGCVGYSKYAEGEA